MDHLGTFSGVNNASATIGIPRHFIACAIAVALLALLGATALSVSGIQHQRAYDAAEARI